MYTNQLGSILTVSDNTGTIVANQSFDAWGRNRNPDNWSYTEPGTPNFPNYTNINNTLPSFLYRGYCGHEMLPEFNLINTNGRMYDPILGRMLSPDDQVQDPFSTQGYNRYSYVTNNPLKYSDPTGWGEWDGVGAMFGQESGELGSISPYWGWQIAPGGYSNNFADWAITNAALQSAGGGGQVQSGENSGGGSNLISDNTPIDKSLTASNGGGIDGKSIYFQQDLPLWRTYTLDLSNIPEATDNIPTMGATSISSTGTGGLENPNLYTFIQY